MNCLVGGRPQAIESWVNVFASSNAHARSINWLLASFSVNYTKIKILRQAKACMDHADGDACWWKMHIPGRPSCNCFFFILRKTKSSAVVTVGRPYRLYPKANARLPVAERKRFPRVNTIPIYVRWRCYIERCSQR